MQRLGVDRRASQLHPDAIWAGRHRHQLAREDAIDIAVKNDVKPSARLPFGEPDARGRERPVERRRRHRIREAGIENEPLRVPTADCRPQRVRAPVITLSNKLVQDDAQPRAVGLAMARIRERQQRVQVPRILGQRG